MALPVSLFEKLNLFHNATPQERHELDQAAQVINLKKGATLFQRGDTVRFFYIVAEGAVRLHRETPDGKDVTLQVALIADTVGEQAIFDRKTTYSAHATALEDSMIVAYEADWMLAKMRSHTGLALNMLAMMSQSAGRLSLDKEHVAFLKTPQRLACFLLRICSLHALDPGCFTLPYSKTTIASTLGMEPESFSRALLRLRDVGVTTQGHTVHIADLAQLEEYACGSCSVAGDCPTCRHYGGNTPSQDAKTFF